MNTFITRIWLNNTNNFVISDNADKHAAAVANMIAKGGRKLDSEVAAHELGIVIVLRGDQVAESKS